MPACVSLTGVFAWLPLDRFRRNQIPTSIRILPHEAFPLAEFFSSSRHTPQTSTFTRPARLAHLAHLAQRAHLARLARLARLSLRITLPHSASLYYVGYSITARRARHSSSHYIIALHHSCHSASHYTTPHHTTYINPHSILK